MSILVKIACGAEAEANLRRCSALRTVKRGQGEDPPRRNALAPIRRFREAQAYGQQRTAELGIDPADVPARVQEFLKDIDAHLATIAAAAEHGGGGIVAEVPRTVHDCPDHEDNLILDLAAEVGALIVVSVNHDLSR